MNAIMDNKWAILLTLEALAWGSTFWMLYARYSLLSTGWFRVGVALFTVTGIIPQVALGVINFVNARKLDLFTVIIALLIIYGLTIGKKHVKKLDAWAQAKFAERRTRP